MTKFFLGCLIFVLTFFKATMLFGAVKIQSVGVRHLASGLAVDLHFDKPVSADALKPEYERNFVQLVLRSTRMDSARILPVSNSLVEKVFVYPYSPEVARVRVILNKSNDWAQGKVSLSNISPKTIRFFLNEKDPSQQTQTTVNSVRSDTVTAEHEAPKVDMSNPDSLKEALGEVKKGSDAMASAVAATATATPSPQIASAIAKETSIGTKSEPSKYFMRMIAALFGILVVFGGVILLLRKYASKLKKLPFSKKERIIQVVATHYLGSKKSISLVKVTGEYMVVGVSNEGISLITKLGPEVNVDTYLEDRFWNGTFEKHLDKHSKDQAKEQEIEGLSEAITESSIRQNIREKLTKLKPLS